ncbi:hypothetical protein MIND_01174800 [Mycena indigotica]|uniref:C4-dicarboxylate transporter/malic acid transport protein n=1 Tax=Mycena indigotica TaxID=2126181 RepID=A0A8H6S5L3_9AGAR|nr:uncharacterized protein MIND_01174800 [Mycena indigotica]KAF7292763.1 hypothetical protein MIND_01174800 [Mycena indigotica]
MLSVSSLPVRKNLKTCVRHFTWAWYTIVMGTCVVASLVNRFHWGSGSEPNKVLTLVLFFCSLLCFVLISAASVARYIIFPELWSAMLRHPIQSLFISAMPMAGCSLINIALVAHQKYGFSNHSRAFLYALWAFWWLDVVISVVIAFGMLHVMMTKQKHSLEQLSCLAMLPVLPWIVASATGGLLATALPTQSTLTIAVSAILGIAGLSIAFMVITAYLLRLLLHGPPDTSLILASFIPLGPMGQGGFSLLLIAEYLSTRNVDLGPLISPSAVASVAFCLAWTLWSLGLFWLGMTLCMIYASVRQKRVPYSIGYWGMIFPTGVMALLTVEMGDLLKSAVIQYIGVTFSIGVALLWVFVVVKTIPAVWNTTAFNSPCATKLDEEKLSTACSTAVCMSTIPRISMGSGFS